MDKKKDEAQTEKPDTQAANGKAQCTCPEVEPNKPLPGENDSIRRLLKALEEEIEFFSNPPTDATKKFTDDLKELDKEYQGLAGIVRKYEEAHEKLVCPLAEANSNKQEIKAWCDGKVNEVMRQSILDLWWMQYESKGKTICCNWIETQNQFTSLQDCLRQSEKKVDELKQDFDAFKNFEKTVQERLGELKALHEKAKAFQLAGRHQSVCAVLIEYCNNLANLGTFPTWAERKNACGCGTTPPAGAPATFRTDCDKWQPSTFLDIRPPRWLETKLRNTLQAFIRAKYQRFRWQHNWNNYEADTKKSKEACEKFSKNRREEFFQEAGDLTPPPSSGGSESGKGSGEKSAALAAQPATAAQ